MFWWWCYSHGGPCVVLDSSGHGSIVQLNGLTVHLNKRGEKKNLMGIAWDGKVFGELRLIGESHFFLGLQLGVRYSLVTIWGKKVLLLLIGVLCIVVVERQWIIYCFIVRMLISCSVLSSYPLEFLGSYQEWYQIFFLVGGVDWGALVKHLEFSFVMLDMVSMGGVK